MARIFRAFFMVVTNARKFCAINRLWALFAEITIPLYWTHTWCSSRPSGCAVYFLPFSSVATKARSPNPLGIFRAISQFCSVRRETPKCFAASSCVNLRLSR